MKPVNPSSAGPVGVRPVYFGFPLCNHPTAPGPISPLLLSRPSLLPYSFPSPFACRDPGVCREWKAGCQVLEELTDVGPLAPALLPRTQRPQRRAAFEIWPLSILMPLPSDGPPLLPKQQPFNGSPQPPEPPCRFSPPSVYDM